MQRVLVIVVGLLGITLVFMLGLLLWQKNFPSSSLSSVPLSLSVSPVPVSLPFSSQNKPGIRFVKLSDEFAQQGFIGWADGDFFYGAKKTVTYPILPFSVMGVVKKVKANKIEIEAAQNKGDKIVVKLELSKDGHITDRKTKQNATIRVGEKIRVLRLHHKVKNAEYFVINDIEILT